MTLEEKLGEWLKQRGTSIVCPEREFIKLMRKAAAEGVGYGWMQQIIEWEWQSKGPGAWGPEYFNREIQRLEKKKS